MTGIVFSLLALSLAVASAILVLRALSRHHADDKRHEVQQAREWLRQVGHRELEEAREIGDLLGENLEQAKGDLDKMVAAFAAHDHPVRQSHDKLPKGVKVGIVVLFALLTTGLYAVYGDWHYMFLGPMAAQRHDLRVALTRYQRHLKRHPDDLRGWRALARGYELVGEDRRAAAAYRHLVRHGGAEDPTILADYAQALILEDPNHLDARELAIANRSLDLDPDQPKALWWGGLLALVVSHDRQRAITLWNRLLRDPSVPVAVRSVVASRVVALGGTPARPIPSVLTVKPIGSHAWRIRVTLDSNLAGGAISGRARLYVFLRDPLVPMHPPYYVRAVPHPVFPVMLTLSSRDDPMGVPQRLPRELELVALVSRNGLAQPAPGDLVGRRLYTRSYLMSVTHLSVRVDHKLGGSHAASLTHQP